jgi:hypothetical protein
LSPFIYWFVGCFFVLRRLARQTRLPRFGATKTGCVLMGTLALVWVIWKFFSSGPRAVGSSRCDAVIAAPPVSRHVPCPWNGRSSASRGLFAVGHAQRRRLVPLLA